MRQAIILILLLLPSALLACPFCASDTSSEIRAQIFGTDFIENLLTGISPFIVFGIITGVIYKSGKNKS